MRNRELVQQIFPLHSPKTQGTADKLDALRNRFMVLALDVVDGTVETPEQTIFVRKMHDALQAAITAVVLYQ